MSSSNTVILENISKTFGSFKALNNVNLEVQTGKIFGLLGPNGSGKSTTLDIIMGFKKPDNGKVSLFGQNIANGRLVREKIGLMLQETALFPYLTVKETLQFFASLYEKSYPIDELLKMLKMESSVNKQVRKLSGGQRRKLDLGVAMIGLPKLLILDEPTTGFDPVSKHETWETIKKLRDSGTTIVITTQIMDEAEYLCDKLAILINGEVVIQEEMQLIKDNYNNKYNKQSSVVIHFAEETKLIVDSFPDAIKLDEHGCRWMILNQDVTKVTQEVHQIAAKEKIKVEDIDVKDSSLEEIFIELVKDSEGVGQVEKLV